MYSVCVCVCLHSVSTLTEKDYNVHTLAPVMLIGWLGVSRDNKHVVFIISGVKEPI